MVDYKNITFHEFMEIRKKIYENAAKIRKEEIGHCYNLPREDGYHNKLLEQHIESGKINESNFHEQWLCEHVVQQWNGEPYGYSYEELLSSYEEIAKDPRYIARLNKIYERGGRSWGYVWKKTKSAIEAGKFISFWEYTLAYNDTRGSWRHWWDALSHPDRFKVGDIVELRGHTTKNNVFIEHTHPYQVSYTYLRNINRTGFLEVKKKVLMVIAYDQKKPDRTYSYKKTQGSHRLITVLPMGSTKMYYIPEQFIKLSRKKAVKEAKK